MRQTTTLAIGFLVAASFGAAHADTGMLGGFIPVALGETARSVWVNPAAVPTGGRSSVVTEVVWQDAWASGLEPGEITWFNSAISTPKSAFGFQKNFADVPGSPSWTLALARPAPVGEKTWLGGTVEWKHGNGSSTIDGTLGALMMMGQELRLAVVVENLLETRETDRRLWRGGAAWRKSRVGYMSWDLQRVEGQDGVHWFGLGLDRIKGLALAGHANLDGDWNAAITVGADTQLIGFGMSEVERQREARFLSWDHRPEPTTRSNF